MKNILYFSILSLALFLTACNNDDAVVELEIDHQARVVSVLESLETGNTDALEYINPNKYIQHNLQVGDGRGELENFISILPRPETTVRTRRIFQDGDFVFAHSEYNVFGPKVGFDIFRYEDGLIVEHWDNLQETPAPNPSGRTLIDGDTELKDLDKTEENKALVRKFVVDILQNGQAEDLPGFFDGENYIQHNPFIGDGVSNLVNAFQSFDISYETIHMVLGQGNFVLVAVEGKLNGTPTAFYDLFRVENGKIAEHWDIIEAIPPATEWQNTNGKF